LPRRLLVLSHRARATVSVMQRATAIKGDEMAL
jgi:hypothetical protein